MHNYAKCVQIHLLERFDFQFSRLFATIPSNLDVGGGGICIRLNTLRGMGYFNENSCV